jgi:NAD(P)-dependent dehydrogenase (short-subunit alcohol dehydrogenase family)
MSRAGHTFIVTGGASGLGEATVRRLHADGGNVAILDLDRQEEKAQELIKDLGDADRLMWVPVDVTDAKSVEKAVYSVASKFGGLQGVINCAGT